MKIHKIICDNCRKETTTVFCSDNWISIKIKELEVYKDGRVDKTLRDWNNLDFCCPQCLKEWVEK